MIPVQPLLILALARKVVVVAAGAGAGAVVHREMGCIFGAGAAVQPDMNLRGTMVGRPIAIRTAAGPAAGTAECPRSPESAAPVGVVLTAAGHRSGLPVVVEEEGDAAALVVVADRSLVLLYRQSLGRCSMLVAPVDLGVGVAESAAEAVTADIKVSCGAVVAVVPRSSIVVVVEEAGRIPAAGAAGAAGAVVAAVNVADKRIADKVAPVVAVELRPGLKRTKRGPETLERSLRQTWRLIWRLFLFMC